MEITYEVKRIDVWRSSLFTLLSHPQMVGLIKFPFLLALAFGLPSLVHLDVLRFAMIALPILAGWCGFVVACIAISVFTRIPNPRIPRICTTRFTKSGVCDISPNKTLNITWDM